MEAVARERKVGAGFGVVALAAVLGVISLAISLLGGSVTEQFDPQNFPEIPPEVFDQLITAYQIGLPISTAIYPFAWWLLVTLLMQIVTRFFGGSGPISGMFAVTGVAYVPFLIAGMIGIFIVAVTAVVDPQSAVATVLGLVNILLTLVFWVWHIALVVIGAKFARNVSYGQSGGSCALSCLDCGGLSILVLIVGVIFFGPILAGGG